MGLCFGDCSASYRSWRAFLPVYCRWWNLHLLLALPDSQTALGLYRVVQSRALAAAAIGWFA